MDPLGVVTDGPVLNYDHFVAVITDLMSNPSGAKQKKIGIEFKFYFKIVTSCKMTKYRYLGILFFYCQSFRYKIREFFWKPSNS